MANIVVPHDPVRAALARQTHAFFAAVLLVTALVAPVATVDRAGDTSADWALESSHSVVVLLGHGVQALAHHPGSWALVLTVLGCGLFVTACWIALASVVRGRGVLDPTARHLWTWAAAGTGLGAGLVLVAGLLHSEVDVLPGAGVLVGLAVWAAVRPLVSSMVRR